MSKASKFLEALMGVNINDDAAPWTEWILTGKKTVETRNSPSLNPYVGKRVGIIRTGKGKKATLVGYATVGQPIKYDSLEQFNNDFSKHHVVSDSSFYNGGVKYGYPLSDVERTKERPVDSRGIVARKLEGVVKRLAAEVTDVSKASMSLNEVRKILEDKAEEEVEKLFRAILPGTSFAGKVHSVGGYVRDQLMGIPSKDLDIVIEMEDGAEKFSSYVHKMFPSSTSTPYLLGKGYPIYNLSFKDDIEYKGKTYHTKGASIDIADTMEEEFPDPESRQRKTKFGNLDKDIKRRDFTVNMLLRDLTSGELKDMTGVSQEDIKKGILRGHPAVDLNKIFSDDPLRMIRLIRFKVKYDWTVPQDVIEITKKNAHRIKIISAERIRDELEKIIKYVKLPQAITLMKQVGLLQYILPEIEDMEGLDQGKHHGEDLYDHTLMVLQNAPTTLEGQLAALLHDVGKRSSMEIIGDEIKFHGHEDAGADIAKAILRRLKFPNEVINKVVVMVKNHMRVHHLQSGTDKALRRFIRDVGNDILGDLIQLGYADSKGRISTERGGDDYGTLKDRIHGLQNATVKVVNKPVLDGNEIMTALGIKPGPKVKEVQQYLLDLQDEGEEISKEDAIKKIKQKFGESVTKAQILLYLVEDSNFDKWFEGNE